MCHGLLLISCDNTSKDSQENTFNQYSIIPNSRTTTETVQENDSLEANVPQENSNDNNDDDYFSQFCWPDDSDDDSKYFENESNDEIFLRSHLDRNQLNSTRDFEEIRWERSKQSNKKIKAARQIKTKHAKSIKYKSHNKQLYMHHRLFKKTCLDSPSQHYLPSSSLSKPLPNERIDSIQHQWTNQTTHFYVKDNVPLINNYANNNRFQFGEYTINQNNMIVDPSFDAAMINLLMDMQNRDLSPEDYETLLRLDERVQRKTVDTNVLDQLPSIKADETHTNERCSICIESYTVGQKLKLLPCKHIFHADCIETYLKQFSVQCPLDNLPLT